MIQQRNVYCGLIGVSAAVFLATGCTREATENAVVSLKIPVFESASLNPALSSKSESSSPGSYSNSNRALVEAMNKALMSTSVGTTDGWALADPMNISEISCFALVVEGPEPELQSRLCQDQSGQTVARAGVISGAVAQGGTLSAEVPSGSDRTLYLVGFRVSSDQSCPNLPTIGVERSYSSPPVIIAKQRQNLPPGNVQIVLTASMTAAVKFESCGWPLGRYFEPPVVPPPITEAPPTVDESTIISEPIEEPPQNPPPALPPLISSFTVAVSSPTATMDWPITLISASSYTHYCILENDIDITHCGWQAAPFPAILTVSAANNSKVLSAWLKDSNGEPSLRADSNPAILDTIAPLAPTALQLSHPGTSPGSYSTPIINIVGVSSGNTVRLFTDPNCSNMVSSNLVASGSSIALTSAPLSPGSYVFYSDSTDSVGNVSNCSVASVAYVYDNAVPQIMYVDAPSHLGGPYKAGAILNIVVGFSDPVVVSGGPPFLTLETGITDRPAYYISGSGSSALIFAYNVQPGDTSSLLDYTSSTALSPNGATIRNLAGTDANLALPAPATYGSLSYYKNIQIDTTPPGAFIISGVTGDADLIVDDWLTGGNVPTLHWQGSNDAVSYDVFITDFLGVSVICYLQDVYGTSFYGVGCALSQTGYKISIVAKDAAENTTVASNFPFNFWVDSEAPVIDNFAITTSSPTNSNLWSLEFSASGLPTEYCVLEDDSDLNNCSWLTLPLPTLFSVSGVNNFKTLYAWVRDSAGNVSNLGISNTVEYDGTAPLAPSLITLDDPIASPGNDPTPTFGVQGVSDNDLVQLFTDPGCTAGSGFSGVVSGSFIQITTSPLPTGSHTFYANSTDLAGNVSACSTSFINYEYNASVPTIANVWATESDGPYKAGTTININVDFSEVVTVVGGYPYLILETGSTDQYAYYTSGSGTSILTFVYVVQSGDISNDLDYASGSALEVNGATIRNGAGTDASLVLASPGDVGSLSFNKNLEIDTTAPGVLSINGAAGGTDSNFDAWLTSGNVVTAQWQYSSGAAFYDLKIRDQTDAYDVCPSQTTAALSWDFSGCPLIEGVTYLISVVATDLAGNSTGASNNLFSFTIDSGPPSFYGDYSLAAISDEAVILMWDPANDYVSSSDQISYEICQRGSPGICTSSFSVDYAPSPTFWDWVINTLSSTGDHFFTIRARDLAGNLSSLREIRRKHVTASQISSGSAHTCVVTSDTPQSVKCWGDNMVGQHGTGSFSGSESISEVMGLSSPTSVSAGSFHSCALQTGGSVGCWGYNYFGQLGNGLTVDSATPVYPTLYTSAQQVSAGFSHTCTVLTDGKIQCWGNNQEGQLGNNTNVSSLMPVTVANLTSLTAVEVAVGVSHTCARFTDQSVRCWGKNTFGQLGNGTFTGSQVPVVVSTLSGTVLGITSAANHSCALLGDNTVKCWGYNFSGQLGDNSNTTRDTPVSVSGLTGVTEISGRGDHTCARIFDGQVFCWGRNFYSELGDNTGLIHSPV